MMIRKSFLALAFAAALPATALGATLKESFDKTLALGKGGTVSVDNVNGSITVSSWDRPDVKIHAEKKVEGNGDAAAKAMAALRITAEAKGGDVVVETKHPDNNGGGFFDWITGNDVNASVRYEITVPRDAQLEVETVNGKISVTGINGRMGLSSTNGGIEIAKSAGEIDVSTTNGAIRAELSGVGKGIDARTTNGGVKLTLPEGLRAQVDLSTTNGSVRSDFPVTIQRSDRNTLKGTVNGGGTQVRVRTTNGSIDLLQGPAASAQK